MFRAEGDELSTMETVVGDSPISFANWRILIIDLKIHCYNTNIFDKALQKQFRSSRNLKLAGEPTPADGDAG